MEQWRSLDGIVENGKNYAVSTKGKVKNTITGKVLKAAVKRTGYLQVVLQLDSKQKHYPVHRLVALAFIDNLENKPYVNHKDGIKSNNNLDNLEWVTARENYIHALKMGLASNEKQTKSLIEYNSQPVIQYDLEGVEINRFSSCAEAARNTDMLADTIRKQCRNESRSKFTPYYFRFVDKSQKEREAN